MKIGYLVIVVQLLWYLIIVRYVDTIEDAYKVIWGIITAMIIWIFIVTFSTSSDVNIALHNIGIAFESSRHYEKLYYRLGNHYAVMMSSTLCLLPILFYKAHKWGKVLIVALAVLFGEELLATKCRGALLSFLPVFLYPFLPHKSKKEANIFILMLIIITILAWDKVLLALKANIDFFVAADKRYLMSAYTLQRLMAWPYFLVGFGMGTLNNWIMIPHTFLSLHGVHQTFLLVWVHTGLAGFLGFIYWLGYSIWAGIKKAMRCHVAEEKLVLLGLVLSISSWAIFFMTTGGPYTGMLHEANAIFTTEVGLLVALGQKQKLTKCEPK